MRVELMIFSPADQKFGVRKISSWPSNQAVLRLFPDDPENLRATVHRYGFQLSYHGRIV